MPVLKRHQTLAAAFKKADAFCKRTNDKVFILEVIGEVVPPPKAPPGD